MKANGDIEHVPPIRSFHAVDAAMGALERVQAQLRACEGEIDAMLEARSTCPDPRMSRAEALLRGEVIAAFEPENEQKVLAALRTRRNDLTKALELGKKAILEARAAASMELVPQFIERHRALVKRVCLAAVALSLAHQEECDLRHALEAAGYSSSSFLRPMPYTGHVLRVDEHWSSVNLYLKEALDYHFLTRAEVKELSPVLFAHLPSERSKP